MKMTEKNEDDITNLFIKSVLNSQIDDKSKLEKINHFIQENYYSRQLLEQSSEKLIDVLLTYALHNYSNKVLLDNEDDTLNAVATSVNLLGEELNHSTVTRHYLLDIFNSMTDMLFVVDNEGYIDSINQSARVKLEYPQEELMKAKIDTILADGISFNQIKNSKNSQIYTLLTKNGKRREVELMVSGFVRGDNETIGSVIIARDISELLKYQQEIEEINQKLTISNEELIKALELAEENDKLKTAFLQNISHEIRTPLNVITGLIQLINNFEISPEERFEYSEIMEKSSRRLIEIVNNVLDISRIETGQLKVNYRNFSLNTVLKDIFSSFYLESKDKGIKFEYHAPFADGEDIIETDNGKLNQILTNLVKNSIKFTENGKVEFGYEQKPDFIQFFVKDTGIGIEETMKEKIFDRFVQAQNNFGKLYDGAGLGLSICKGLSELLGGTIWFESIVGKGTNFYFTIPHQSKKVMVDNEIKIPSYEIGNRSLNILIAEDDDLNFLYFDKMMKSLKHKVIRAKNGREAVELCKTHLDLDVILMDIKMPEMDGMEATRIIKTFNTETPVIALTAFAFNEERESIVSAGFDEYVSKPIRIEDLFKAIKKCMGI